MSLSKEIVEQENSRFSANCMELHLYQEGSFLRAYDWSAWLACRFRLLSHQYQQTAVAINALCTSFPLLATAGMASSTTLAQTATTGRHRSTRATRTTRGTSISTVGT